MANKHSFTITLSNNKTEKEGINYLLEQGNFLLPNTQEKRDILAHLNIDQKFLRAFDLVYSKTGKFDEKSLLVELKTTKKALPDNPHDFFFGATESEYNLARELGDKFRFCFVCLAEPRSYVLLTFTEVERRTQNKRIQYQVLLK